MVSTCVRNSILNFAIAFISYSTTVCQSPTKKDPKDIKVGGVCDRCEIMYEGMPSIEKINWQTRLADNTESGEKMNISGIIYKRDGKTPAPDIILYIYHTDAKGLYTPAPDQKLGRINGKWRGWVKSNAEGKFSFTSIRPAPYPDANIPAHIHILVKEPGKSEYYIDEVWFEGDRFITNNMKNNLEHRGGNFIIPLTKNRENEWSGTIKIVLGLNIPGYK